MLKEPKKVALKPEEKLHETAEGRFVLDHEDWTITVTAGTGDLQSMLVTLGELQTTHDALLRQYDVPSVEEAAKRAEVYKAQKKRVDTKRAALQAVLANEAFGAVEARVNALPPVAAGRSHADIVRELTQTSADISTRRAALAAAESEIAGWLKIYGNQESLQNTLLGKLAEQKGIDTKPCRTETSSRRCHGRRRFRVGVRKEIGDAGLEAGYPVPVADRTEGI